MGWTIPGSCFSLDVDSRKPTIGPSTWPTLPGLLKKSNRGLEPKVVSRISSLLPQFVHNIAIRQRYVSTLDDVKDTHLPWVLCN